MPGLAVVLMVGLSAQVLPPARSAAAVRTLPTFAQLAPAGPQTELAVRWIVNGAASPETAAAAGARTEPSRFEIRRRSAAIGPPVGERDPQIGQDDLVIVAVDADGREVAWQRVKDPRIVRSEQPGSDGLLTGRTLMRTETELVVFVPASLTSGTLRVYEPRWDGREMVLQGLGTIDIGR